jgi:acetyl-CoA carboxylase biotin carboxyl carrier protein
VKLGKAGNHRPPLTPDAELVRALAALLTETGLTEIEYAVGDHRIRVARGSLTSNAPITPTVVVAAPDAALSRPLPLANGEAHPKEPAADHPGTLKSPMVGVAYLAPQPGAPPFVRVGDRVAEGQTMLIIEAMKVMNQIRAPRAGVVVQIFIEDAEPVEYGAALMLVE